MEGGVGGVGTGCGGGGGGGVSVGWVFLFLRGVPPPPSHTYGPVAHLLRRERGRVAWLVPQRCWHGQFPHWLAMSQPRPRPLHHQHQPKNTNQHRWQTRWRGYSSWAAERKPDTHACNVRITYREMGILFQLIFQKNGKFLYIIFIQFLAQVGIPNVFHCYSPQQRLNLHSIFVAQRHFECSLHIISRCLFYVKL